jgi:hypothetical protein
MTNVFVVDKQYESTRIWEKLEPQPLFCGLHDFEFVHGNRNIDKGIILVHRSFFGLENLEILNTLATLKPELTLVVISGSPQTEGEIVQHRIYYRRASVGEPYDEAFSSCWSAFCHAYNQGNIDFSLLEPRYLPILWALDILCQGYLASHGDSSLSGIDYIDAALLAKAKLHAKVMEDKTWWMRSLSVHSIEELSKKLYKEVSDEISKGIVSKLCEMHTNPTDAIKSMHSLVKEQIS